MPAKPGARCATTGSFPGAALLFVVLLAPPYLLFHARSHPPARPGNRPQDRALQALRTRHAHWSNAIAFVTLAITGIVMAFSRFFLMP